MPGIAGKKFDGPGAAAMAQPLGREGGRPMGLDQFGDAELVGFRGRGGEGQRDLAQAQLEQAVAAPRLAIIVTLRRRPTKDFDLPGIEAEALIDSRDLRFGGALVGQEDARRTAFDNGRRDAGRFDVSEALGGEDDAGVLLPERLQPFAELRREVGAVEDQPAFVNDDERR